MKELMSRLSVVKAAVAVIRHQVNHLNFIPWLSSQARAEVEEMEEAYQFLGVLVAEAANAVNWASRSSDSTEVEEMVLQEILEEIADGLLDAEIGKKMTVAQQHRLANERSFWLVKMDQADAALTAAEKAVAAEAELVALLVDQKQEEVWVVV